MAINRSKIGSAFVSLEVDKNPLIRGLKSSQRLLSNFGSGLASAGGRLVGAGAAVVGSAAAMAAPLVGAMRSGMLFSDAMAKVGAISQASGDQLASMTEKAKELGRTTSFSATQVAEGMVELGRKGFSPEQIEAAIPSVMNLARATDTELALAAEVAGAAMKQFNLDASDTKSIADALTTTANSTSTSVESIGEAMKYAGPVANDLGMSLEETLAIVGALGDVGIGGSSAGTALKRLATTTAADAERLGEIFGQNFVDENGNAFGVVDTLQRINDATKDMGSVERMSKMNDAFSLLGITGASVIGKSGEGIGAILEKIRAGQAAGSAETTAAAMDDNTGGSWRMLMSAIEGVSIAIHDSLAPAFRTVTDLVAAGAGKLTEFIDKNKQLVVQIVAGVAAFGAFGFGLMAAGTALAAVGFAASGIATGIGLLLSPIGLAVGAVTMFAAAWSVSSIDAGSAIESIRGKVQSMIDFLKPVAKGIMDAFAADRLDLAGQIAMEALKVAIKRGLIAIGNMVANMATGIWNALTGALSGNFSGVSSIVNAVDDGIWSLVHADDKLKKLIAEANQAAAKNAASAAESLPTGAPTKPTTTPSGTVPASTRKTDDQLLADLMAAGRDADTQPANVSEAEAARAKAINDAANADAIAELMAAGRDADEQPREIVLTDASPYADPSVDGNRQPGDPSQDVAAPVADQLLTGLGGFDPREFMNQVSQIQPPDFQKLATLDGKFAGMGGAKDPSLGLLEQLNRTNERMLEIEENREPLTYGG